MKRYKEYQDSEIDWIDKIPVGWKINRVKNLGSVNGRVGWKALKASEYVDSGYFFLSTPNIKYRDIDYNNVNYITYERYIESPEIMLRENDILLVKDGSTLGIVNIVRDLPSEGTVNSSIAVLRFKNTFNLYLYYLLSSEFTQNVIRLKKEGMGVPHLFQKDINNFFLLLPPLDEQQEIANYLEEKTQAIDKKIETFSQKIKYLKALKKSIVKKAVYRGLNEDVKIRYSGIDWIGKIPDHWESKRIDNIFTHRSEKVSDKDYPALSVTKKGILPQLKNAAKTKHGDNRKKVLRNDFVINSRSDRKGSSGFSKYMGSVSVINIVLTPRKDVHGKYYHYLFRSHPFTEEFYRQGQGIVDDLWSTKFSRMKIIEVCLPPKEEQNEIAEYLDEKTTKIDLIIANVKKQIGTLKELRKTLVNDVVTGKIKVT